MSTPDFWTPLTRETYDQWKTASPDDYADHAQQQLEEEEQDEQDD